MFYRLIKLEVEMANEYYRLAHYSPYKLIEMIENGTSNVELGNNSETLRTPEFWMYILDYNYKISMSNLDDKDLKTVFNTCKIIITADRTILQYKENKTQKEFTKTHYILGDLLVKSVEYKCFTALYYLITKYGAPVVYEKGIYLAKAIQTGNWYGAPIEALVTSGRLNTFLQDRHAAYNLLEKIIESKRGDLFSYIVTNDTRERRGTSRAYIKFLYKLITNPLKCKKRLTRYLLEQIQYTVESLSEVLETLYLAKTRINKQEIDLKFDVECVSMVVDKLNELDSNVFNSILQTLIYADGSKYLYSIMMKRLQNDKDKYIKMIGIALHHPKFNNRTILNLHKDGILRKDLLRYFDRKTLSTFIKRINKNTELKDMLNKVLRELPE